MRNIPGIGGILNIYPRTNNSLIPDVCSSAKGVMCNVMSSRETIIILIIF